MGDVFWGEIQTNLNQITSIRLPCCSFQRLKEMNDSQEYIDMSDESCDSDNESGVPGVPLKKKTEKAKWTPEEVTFHCNNCFECIE